jgi:hypothetical protein
MLLRFVVRFLTLGLIGVLTTPVAWAQTPAALPDFLLQSLERAGLQVPPEGFISGEGTAAILVPQVYVDHVEATVAADGTITGSFIASNAGEDLVGDIHYELGILGPAPTLVEDQLTVDTAPVYDYVFSPESFVILPGSTTTIPFSLKPVPLPKGTYRLRVQLATSNDRTMGWEDTTLELGGNHPFALLKDAKLLAESTAYDTGQPRSDWTPFEGPNLAPNQNLALEATVSPQLTAPLTVRPTVRVRRLLIGEPNEQQATTAAVTLQPGQEQKLTVPITAATTPGAYAAILSLETETGQRVSTVAEYRYVVRGLSGSIVTASFVELKTKKDETAAITFTIVGPADRETRAKGTVEVAVLDGQTTVGSSSDTIDLSANAVTGTATIVLTQDTARPGLRVTLRAEDGTVLDTYEVSFAEVAGSATSDTPTALLKGISPWHWLLAGVGLVILALLVWLWRRLAHRRSVPPTLPPPVTPTPTPSPSPSPPRPPVATKLMLLLGTLLTVGAAFSAISTRANGVQYFSYSSASGGAPYMNLFVNSPIHGRAYLPNPNISYKATLSWLACGNALNWGSIKVQSTHGNGWRLHGQLAADRTNHPDGWRSFTYNMPLKLTNPAATTMTVWTFAELFAAVNSTYGLIQDFTTVTVLQKSRGDVNEVSCTQIRGWACDPNDFRRPLQVDLYDGQTKVASVTADVFRPDVAAAGVCGGHGNHGFIFSPPASLKDGRPHQISAYVFDLNHGAHNVSLRKDDVPLTCAPDTSTTPPTGACTPQNATLVFTDTLDANNPADAGPTARNGQTLPAGTYAFEYAGGAWSAWDRDLDTTGHPGGGPGLTWLGYFDVAFSSGGQQSRQQVGITTPLFRTQAAAETAAKGQFKVVTVDAPTTQANVFPYIADQPLANRGSVTVKAYRCPVPPTGPPQCSDSKDNDADVLIDTADPGCHTDGNANNAATYDPNDNDETNTGSSGGKPQCSDAADNDADALIDTTDPGCHTDGNASNSASYDGNDNDETHTTVTGSTSPTPTPTFRPGEFQEND